MLRFWVSTVITDGDGDVCLSNRLCRPVHVAYIGYISVLFVDLLANCFQVRPVQPSWCHSHSFTQHANYSVTTFDNQSVPCLVMSGRGELMAYSCWNPAYRRPTSNSILYCHDNALWRPDPIVRQHEITWLWPMLYVEQFRRVDREWENWSMIDAFPLALLGSDSLKSFFRPWRYVAY